MRITRYGRLAALVVIAALLSTTGCSSGGNNSGQSTLHFVWWGNDDRAKATQAAVALFQEKNPSIKVQTEYSAYDAYYQKLSTQIAGGSSPDLFQIDRPNLGEYQGRGVLLKLDEYAGSALHTDGISPQLLAAGKVSDGLYGVPGGQLTQMLVYDPAAFTRAAVEVPAGGWTWTEFGQSMAKVGATGVAGTTDFGWAVDWFEVWLHQHGKALYTDDGKLGFTADDLVAFWTLTGGLREKKAVSPPEATTKMDGSMPNSALVTKQSASEINYDSSLTAYLSAYGAPLKAIALPTDGQSSGMAAMASVSFVVSNRSANKEAAVKLLDFLVNDPEAGKILGTTRGLPPNLQNRSQICAAAADKDKAVCEYEESVKAKVGPAFGQWPKGSAAIKRDFQTVYDDVIFGKVSVSDGAARVIQNATQSLRS